MSLVVGELPSSGTFTEQIDSLFRSDLDDGTSVDFRLVAIDTHRVSDQYDNFSLVFRGPTDLPSVQSIFHLDNDAIGEMDLFLVPIKKDDSGLYFEAVINRLIA